MKKLSIIFCSVLLSFSLKSQSNFSVKYFGLTIHPFGDRLASVQPYKLDKNAHFVANFGAFIKYEKYIWEDILAINAAQGIFSDCSAGLASVSSIGFHLLVKEIRKHRFYIDLGSTLFCREDWNRFEEYKDNGFYKRTSFFGKNWQYGFYPISAMLEYDYNLSKTWDMSIAVAPYPVIAIGIGGKYWFSREFNKSNSLLVPTKNNKKKNINN
jgi:hypothetical protein